MQFTATWMQIKDCILSEIRRANIATDVLINL